METRLGWTIFGKVNGESRSIEKHLSCNIAEVLDNEDDLLHKVIEDFINSDNLGLTSEECVSIKDQKSLDILRETTKRISGEHKFETGLLWIHDEVRLPDNFQTAYNRLLYIEKKMKNDEDFPEKYERHLMQYMLKKVMQEDFPMKNNLSFLPGDGTYRILSP